MNHHRGKYNRNYFPALAHPGPVTSYDVLIGKLKKFPMRRGEEEEEPGYKTH